MADQTIIFGGDESFDQTNLDDGMDDADFEDGGDEAEYMEDGEAPEGRDDDDDEFKLDDWHTLDNPDFEGNSDANEYDPEYDDDVRGQKRKRTRVSFAPETSSAPQNSSKRADVDDTEPFILNEDNHLLSKPSSRVPGTFGRANRRKGESLPAYHKRVSHELDSDDELMMTMRDKGFSDRQIADKLAKDGRVRYDVKSISTRIMRIRLAQAVNVDKLLENGYKEWEFEDDCLLMQAYALADIEISYEIERIRAWRFRKVSEYMRRLRDDALFSANACRERYNSLMEGTSRIPTEMDDDPDTRRAEMEAFRESRELIRNKEQAEKDAKEELERKNKNELRIRNAQKAEETANKRAFTETEKAQRAMNRAAQAQIRAQRAAENQVAKAQRNAQIKRKEAEAEAKKKGKNGSTAKTSTAASALTKPKDITADTPDPRSFLSFLDLSKMCADRGFETFGKGKDELVQELVDADEEWSQNDLKKMCRTKNLNASCNKAQMRYQLAMAAAQVCPSFKAGVAAAAAAGGEDEMVVDAE